ncbi:MAG: PAS domain S-box protein [Candidatus Lambdaproteobacteria bacterium]|nr:PAS domain S-box protein [Candidatus Lambdaproteobacteria bacterium]
MSAALPTLAVGEAWRAAGRLLRRLLLGLSRTCRALAGVPMPEELQQRFLAVIERAEQGIVITQDGVPVFINQALADLLGYASPAELYDPRVMNECIAPGDRARLRRYRIARLRGRPAPSYYQSEAVRRDGTRLWFDNVVSVVPWRGRLAFQMSVVDVTARVKAQKRLEESERILAYAQEISHVGAWEWDLETATATQTAEALRIIGREDIHDGVISFEEFVKLVHPQDRGKVMRHTVAMLRDDVPFDVEYRVVHPDGAIRHVSSKGVAVRDEPGRARRAVGVIQDITAQKTVALALQESERSLANAQVVASLGSWTWDVKANTVHWSDEVFRLLGHAPGSLERSFRTVLGFVHPDDKDAFVSHFRRAAQGAGTYNFDHRLLRRDGALRFMQQQANLYFDDEGRLSSIVGVMQDVTERRLAEEAFRENERALSMAQELTHIGSWSLHFRSGAVRWSDELYRILGVEPAAFPGSAEALLELVSPADLEMVQAAIRDLVERYQPMDLTHRIVRPSGEERTLHSLAVVFRDRNGVPEHVLGTVHDITERQHAEQALRDSEEHYRNLVEGSLQGTAIIEKHIMRFANRALVEILGYDRPEELLNQNSLELFVAPESRAYIAEVHAARYAGRPVPEHYQFQALRRDGRVIWLETMARMVRWQGVPATQATYVDITQRVLAEQKLSESEEKYRNLLEHSMPGIAITLADRYLYVNQAFCNIFGFRSPEEIMGSNQLMIVVAPEEHERLMHYRRERLAGRPAPDRYEFRGLRQDGTRIWLECMANLVSWEGQQGIQLSYIDITERKRSEEALARLASAMDQAQEGIFILDGQGRVDYVNPACERMTGYARAESLGRPFHELGLSYGLAVTGRDGWRRVRESGTSWEGRSRNTRKDGSVYHVECSVSPVRNPAGEILYYVSVQKDVTQQVSLEEQLRRSQRMEAIGTLAGGIAHDFNNLLVPIIGFAELAIEQETPGSQRHKDLGEISKAAYRARDLVTQILQFSRKTESTRERISLVPVAKEVLNLLRVTLPKNIEIQRRIDPELAAVQADSTQLYQVFMNLCVNAGQAMPDGGRMTVSLDNVAVENRALYTRQLISGRFVRFRVQDTGVGMDEGTMAHAVEPFFTTKEVGKGTGLGLSTVYGIVQQHEGFLNIISRPGEGATFEVYLPALDPLPAERLESVLRLAGGHERILLLDDETSITSLYRRVLENLGYAVREINDPRVALAHFQERPGAYDLVIVDQTMPELSGDRVVERLRAERPGLPIILCTGYSESLNSSRAAELGVNAFFYKPNAPYDLGRIVRDVLDRAAGQGT